MKTKRIRLYILLGLIAVGFGWCFKKTPIPDYVVDSAIKSDPSELVWLDNRRLMAVRRKVTEDGQRRGEIVVWTVDAGEDALEVYPARFPVEFSKDTPLDLCYAGGRISYRTIGSHIKRDPETRYYQGQVLKFAMGHWGQEETVEFETRSTDFAIDRFTCGITPIPNRLKGREVVPLRPGDGFIYEGDSRADGAESLVWESDDGSERIVEFYEYGIFGPYENYAPYAISIVYSPFEGRYMMPAGRTGGRWFVPGEKTELVENVGNSYGPWPTKLGYLSQRNRPVGISLDYGKQGLYLSWRGAEDPQVRLLYGIIHAVSVSPNGCRVGVILERQLSNLWGEDGLPKRVRMIDLCRFKDELPKPERPN
ncbi:MAG: hypothetical protein MI741_18500 [Rhodospirillales bacterium]|nr:hypothetical protein [Rhodospirillales bacterium]